MHIMYNRRSELYWWAWTNPGTTHQQDPWSWLVHSDEAVKLGVPDDDDGALFSGVLVTFV